MLPFLLLLLLRFFQFLTGFVACDCERLCVPRYCYFCLLGPSPHVQTEFTKMMAGFFGGEGFVLQRLTGKGDAFVKAR